MKESKKKKPEKKKLKKKKPEPIPFQLKISGEYENIETGERMQLLMAECNDSPQKGKVRLLTLGNNWNGSILDFYEKFKPVEIIALDLDKYDATLMQTKMLGNICRVIKQLIIAVSPFDPPFLSKEKREAVLAGEEVLKSRIEALGRLKGFVEKGAGG